MKVIRVSIPADDQVKGLFGSGSTIETNSNTMHLYWAGSGPGYMLLGGYTGHVANCDGFRTTASVMRNGKEIALLELNTKVRRAFEILPAKEGSSYGLKISPGFDLPAVVDHSDGIEVKLVRTGAEYGSLNVTRSKPALVPGGMIRLLDRKSGDSQVIMLPLPPVEVSGTSTGNIVSSDGTMTVTSNDYKGLDMTDTEVVLDPPGAYKIRSQVNKSGYLTVTLQCLTRVPTDVSVGFKRHGKWFDIERYQVNSAMN